MFSTLLKSTITNRDSFESCALADIIVAHVEAFYSATNNAS
jgi:hypothetical protein